MSFTRFLQDDPLHDRSWYMRLFIEVANELGLPEKAACVLAAMCCFQEAGVQDNDPPRERRIWLPANPTREPTSTQYPHDSESDDGRSVGICQQQRGPNGEPWWGSVADEMNPRTAIRTFMSRLPKGFHANDAWAANNFVQGVQRSGVPDAYAKWWGDAIRLYNEVKAGVPVTVPPPPTDDPAMMPGDSHPDGPWTGDPTWLADVLRAEGLTVIECPGWLERGHGDMGSLAGVICHHTGSNQSTWQSIADGRADLAGPLSQIHLRRDGVVELVAVGVAWHAGTGYAPAIGRHNANGRCIGVEAQNDGKSGWPPAQYDAYVRINSAFCRQIEVPAEGHVLSHQEWDDGDPPTDEGKWDPGGLGAAPGQPADMGKFRRDVQARIDQRPSGDDMAQVPQEQWDRLYAEFTKRFNSRSIYRTPGEGGVDTVAGMVLNVDAMAHQELVDRLAIQYGDPDAVKRVFAVAAGEGADPGDEWAVAHAKQVLEQIPADWRDNWKDAK